MWPRLAAVEHRRHERLDAVDDSPHVHAERPRQSLSCGPTSGPRRRRRRRRCCTPRAPRRGAQSARRAAPRPRRSRSTSVTTPSTSAPLPGSSATVSSSTRASTSASTTFIPSAAKRLAHRPADAAGAAGDDRDPAVQTFHAVATSFPCRRITCRRRRAPTGRRSAGGRTGGCHSARHLLDDLAASGRCGRSAERRRSRCAGREGRPPGRAALAQDHLGAVDRPQASRPVSSRWQ